ncbi:MAG: hypothetical protein R3F11_27670 [Verrucomicrobiales bacterium]
MPRITIATPPASLGVERGLPDLYAGHDAKRAEPYPVLYLLHGSGDNERAWVDVGKADRSPMR